MRILLLLSALFISACSSIDVAHILNEQVLIAETSPQKPPTNVRVYKVADSGECASETQCPLSQLYIAISEYGEYPKKAFYVSPKKMNWQFVKWIKEANFSEEEPTTVFEVSYEVKEKLFFERITVSLNSISYAR